MLPERYQRFLTDIRAVVPERRLFTDPLRTFAYGTDASFYRLVPKVVVRAADEAEVRTDARARRPAATCRSRSARPGTSLSGQAVTDSVLVVLGERLEPAPDPGRWRGASACSPGSSAADANRCLAPYGRKIGPDPASINAAMIGGIAANNASGMCCGTAQNSYRTVAAHAAGLGRRRGARHRATRPAGSSFRTAPTGICWTRSRTLGDEIKADPALAERIRRKYRIKNTTGYSLNALVDFEDPFDILRAPDDRLGGDAGLHLRDHLPHGRRAPATRPAR